MRRDALPDAPSTQASMFRSGNKVGTDTLIADVCIVVVGAAGITLACELYGTNFQVIVLEAGGMDHDEALANDVFAGTAFTPHPPTHEFRCHGFGVGQFNFGAVAAYR